MIRYQKLQLVDDYINALPEWQQQLCTQVRDLVHNADSQVEEVIKRTVLPFFVLNGNICALMAAKTHVNILIYDPDVPDPSHIINQGHTNATAKSVQVGQGDTLNKEALLAMFTAIIARNRAGGWRKLQRNA